MTEVTVAVLVTLDSKGGEAQFVCDALTGAGVTPWLVDVSLRPHEVAGADITGGELAEAGGSSWDGLAALDRNRAAEIMVAGGAAILRARHRAGEFAGVIGLGGANGTSMACSMMRALPHLVPKVMVSAVAATAAVQWYVAESDIAMFPSIGDFTLNRITRGVLENAANAVAAMALARAARGQKTADEPPLIGISSFGGTAGCVDRVTEQLLGMGYEVIHFHASGPGGKALESLAAQGELAGVVDITTHELTDLLVDGVYSAGESRLTSASAAGLPQVIVPGAIDHSNFWIGMVPEKFADREFFQYNAQNLLMRTNAEECAALGRLFAERLNQSTGDFTVVIPKRGYSEHTKRRTHNLAGEDVGAWDKPDVDATFAAVLREHLVKGRIKELDLHINDAEFADVCLHSFLRLMKPWRGPRHII
ncbi:MAG: Tm-1-like ATP-binding domain-containing protein [Alphaproteobacteria bacterium]|nr:Tm-1-like ATP-binding domain-containing protein [Alphaproteobacteria bacterium]